MHIQTKQLIELALKDERCMADEEYLLAWCWVYETNPKPESDEFKTALDKIYKYLQSHTSALTIDREYRKIRESNALLKAKISLVKGEVKAYVEPPLPFEEQQNRLKELRSGLK